MLWNDMGYVDYEGKISEVEWNKFIYLVINKLFLFGFVIYIVVN